MRTLTYSGIALKWAMNTVMSSPDFKEAHSVLRKLSLRITGHDYWFTVDTTKIICNICNGIILTTDDKSWTDLIRKHGLKHLNDRGLLIFL